MMPVTAALSLHHPLFGHFDMVLDVLDEPMIWPFAADAGEVQ